MTSITDNGELIYGMQLPIQTLSRSLRVEWEDQASVADLRDIAEECDASPMSFIGVCDHIAIPDDSYSAKMTTTWYDTVATLGYLAAATDRIRLLSVVLVAAYRHPLQIAKAFGTLDHLSGGRAILGVGAGHVENEFKALGIDFHSRGKLLDETLRAVRAAFEKPYVSFEGEHFAYDKVGIAPQPRDDLPIWVGGMGKAAWRRTGELGDGYIPMGNQLDSYPEIIEIIRSSAANAGRSDATFDIGWMPGLFYVGEPGFDAGPWSTTGTPEQLADSLRNARAVGINTVHLRFANRSKAELIHQIQAFGETVWPLVN
ncbi:MAG: TIGR03619 family F420-dependent LLM class oxidoreductase [Acidimicrobiales bacterium]